MIKGDIIQLRAVNESDSKFYNSWINDTETNQWRGLYFPESAEASHSFLQELYKNSMERLTLTICMDEIPIGLIGLRNICSRSRRAELWIYLGDKTRWNGGIGTDATRSLVDFGFKEMNLQRIWLECDPEYQPAIKLYTKLGFQTEGILRSSYFRRGKYRNSCIMGLLAIEWTT